MCNGYVGRMQASLLHLKLRWWKREGSEIGAVTFHLVTIKSWVWISFWIRVRVSTSKHAMNRFRICLVIIAPELRNLRRCGSYLTLNQEVIPSLWHGWKWWFMGIDPLGSLYGETLSQLTRALMCVFTFFVCNEAGVGSCRWGSGRTSFRWVKSSSCSPGCTSGVVYRFQTAQEPVRKAVTSCVYVYIAQWAAPFLGWTWLCLMRPPASIKSRITPVTS